MSRDLMLALVSAVWLIIGCVCGFFMGKEGVATNDMEYFTMVHQFALNKLKNHDGVFNIRRYFKDVLWPERS